jgi:hypothetical protein
MYLQKYPPILCLEAGGRQESENYEIVKLDVLNTVFCIKYNRKCQRDKHGVRVALLFLTIKFFSLKKKHLLPGLMSRSLSESDLSELDGVEITREEESRDTSLPSSGGIQHLQPR